VAIIGAGYDTRAYRLPGIDGARVVEFDLPATLNHKRHALEERLGRLPEHVTYSELDLESPSAETALGDAGIVSTEPAVVICEGVTQYVSASAVDRLLTAVGALCTGSELIFTYVLEGVVRERDGFADAAQSLTRGGPKWIFGLVPSRLPSLLAECGLSLIEDVGAGEFKERYLSPVDRRLTVSPYERIVRAVVA
jgi:methyltransferase (TIGR00027 family)